MARCSLRQLPLEAMEDACLARLPELGSQELSNGGRSSCPDFQDGLVAHVVPYRDPKSG